MGGPTYTILKAISAVLLARKHQTVPIFWLASEDHDTQEINHTYLLNPYGNLQEFRIKLPHEGQSVEDLLLTSEAIVEAHNFLDTVQKSNWKNLLQKGNSYAESMASLLAHMFAGTDLLFIEPRLLRSLAIPFFKKEIEDASKIKETLESSVDQLKALQKCSTVNVAATNLFMKTDDGLRRRILLKDGSFIIENQLFSKQRLLTLIENAPERFSPNVLSRPVLQNWLFPVLAYVAGPNELLYLRQLKEYHHFYGITMPVIVPRLSATVIPAFAAQMLTKLDLEPWGPFPTHWDGLLGPYKDQIEDLFQTTSSSGRAAFQDLWPNSGEQILKHSADKLKKRIFKRQLKKLGLPYYALHYLNNLIRPHNRPQERVLNWLGFQAQSNENLISSCLENLSWNQSGHLYLFPD